MSGRAVGYSETAANFTHTVGYEYDNINNLTQLVESINGVEKTTSYTYDEDNRATAITTDGTTVEYTYDGLGRVTQQVTKNGDTVILTEYFTFTEPSDTAASGQVATYRTVSANLDITYSYQYDRNGNITQVYDGTYYSSYVYDSANQLIRENNQRKNASYTWSYDNAGNILTFKTYAYTTSTLGDETDSVGYGYTDSQWGDLLKSLDGSSVDYEGENSENNDINNIGNPSHIGELDLTWRHGRQLATLTKNGVTWSYTYNNAGLRTGRTNGSTTYKYVYNGSRLVQMTILTGANPETARKEVLDFTYDASGTPLTLKYAGNTYYYMVNLQGDVTGILDSSGNRILDYGYTAYGQAVVRATTVGNTANTLARINPLLYRGYVLDVGTGLYYLQSRYYDPTVGRFLNADGLVSTGQGLTGNNMFAYCGNNPVNRADPTGNWWWVIPIIIIPILLTGCDDDSIESKEVTTENQIGASQEGISTDVPLYAQGKSNLCWAFCQVMLDSYYSGNSLAPHEAAEQAVSIAKSVYPDYWNQAGLPLNAERVGIPTLEELSELGPCYAGYSDGTNGHMVVVTKVDLETGLIYTNDPWDKGSRGVQTYDEFVNGLANSSNGMKLDAVFSYKRG